MDVSVKHRRRSAEKTNSRDDGNFVEAPEVRFRFDNHLSGPSSVKNHRREIVT